MSRTTYQFSFFALFWLSTFAFCPLDTKAQDSPDPKTDPESVSQSYLDIEVHSELALPPAQRRAALGTPEPATFYQPRGRDCQPIRMTEDAVFRVQESLLQPDTSFVELPQFFSDELDDEVFFGRELQRCCSETCTDCAEIDSLIANPNYSESDESGSANRIANSLARSLITQLSDSTLSETEKMRVVLSSFEVIQETSRLESARQMAQMKSKYERSIATMQGTIMQMTAQASLMQDFRKWMGPLYSNQNRCLQQTEMLTDTTRALNQTLRQNRTCQANCRTCSLMQSEPEQSGFDQSPRTGRIDRERNAQADYEAELKLNSLRYELKLLEERIQELKIERQERNWPTKFKRLEPVYPASYPLTPMPLNQKHEQKPYRR